MMSSETGKPQGHWIVLEGVDGSGKSTQIIALKQKLEAQGQRVLCTREPGGTQEAEKIRVLLQEDTWLPKSQILLLLAARLEHFHHVIQPALEQGAWVLSDRFWLSTLAYQGYGFETGEHLVMELHETLLGRSVLYAPHLTFFLDLPLTLDAQRSVGKKRDVFERQSEAFFLRVRQGYARAKCLLGSKGISIDGASDPDTITQKIWHTLKNHRFI